MKKKDRIRRPKEFEDFMSDLAIKNSKEKKVFTNLKDLLVFCAAFCAHEGKEYKRPFKETAEENLLMFYEKDPYAMEFLNALAIYDTEDVLVISPERHNEKLEIFAEYASGGLALLKQKLGKLNVDYEKQITTLLTQESSNDNILDSITDLRLK